MRPAQTVEVCYGDAQSTAPSCTERRHDWSVDRGTCDSNDGAMIHEDACSHCGTVRRRRRSYLGIANRPGPYGDGRDWTRYYEAIPIGDHEY